MPVAAMRSLMPVLLLLFGAPEVSGQFLKNLQKMKPGSLTAPFAGKSPGELVQALKDKAAATSPSDIADKIKEVLNGTAAQASAQDLREATTNALQDLAGRSPRNISEALNAAGPQQKQQLAEALQAASDALQRGAGVIVNASAADVQGALQDAAQDAGGLPGRLGPRALPGSWEALQRASPDDLAAALRDASPQVADALNRTSLQLAEVLREKSPEAAALLNRTGHEVASALVRDDSASGTRVPFMEPTEDEVPADGEGLGGRRWAPLSGVLLLVLSVAAAYLVVQRYKGGTQRSPMLLSDALDAVRTHGSARSARAPGLQPAAQEPLFVQF